MLLALYSVQLNNTVHTIALYQLEEKSPTFAEYPDQLQEKLQCPLVRQQPCLVVITIHCYKITVSYFILFSTARQLKQSCALCYSLCCLPQSARKLSRLSNPRSICRLHLLKFICKIITFIIDKDNQCSKHHCIRMMICWAGFHSSDSDCNTRPASHRVHHQQRLRQEHLSKHQLQHQTVPGPLLLCTVWSSLVCHSLRLRETSQWTKFHDQQCIQSMTESAN